MCHEHKRDEGRSEGSGYAIKLEKLGLRHSSGRSVRAHACRTLGLKPRMAAESVIGQIDAILARGTE